MWNLFTFHMCEPPLERNNMKRHHCGGNNTPKLFLWCCFNMGLAQCSLHPSYRFTVSPKNWHARKWLWSHNVICWDLSVHCSGWLPGALATVVLIYSQTWWFGAAVMKTMGSTELLKQSREYWNLGSISWKNPQSYLPSKWAHLLSPYLCVSSE